ncbi:MAG: chemotaxis protein CheX [Candidatus Eisenbacteria bacterium]|nr:chemotaxis protein CheX [Candidatus Eisenbacteria bacterium]
MTTTKSTIQEWLNAAVDATEELSTTALGFEGTEVLATQESLPHDLAGSYIALVGEETSLQVGLASSDAGVMILAKALLGMDPDDEEALSESDVSDALGEIANIVAGGVKNRMADRDPSMKLGLPMIVHGHVQATDRMQTAIADVRIGPVEAQLLVLREGSA